MFGYFAEGKFYLELTMKAEASASYTESRKRPLVRCDSEAISRKVGHSKVQPKKHSDPSRTAEHLRNNF